MERFQREAETVAGLHHTNIVPIFAVGDQRGVAYYAMQFIRGRSLAEVLAVLRTDGRPLDSVQIARWGLQAAEALAHAHEHGVIHRDVKPSNLILADDGRIWLTDFGLAKRLDDVTLSVTGAILGTPRYMSPEQASAAKYPVDARTDIYSLGASLYELATGQPVFDADSPYGVINKILTTDPRPPRRLRADLPRDLETVILRCLMKAPGGRYPTAQELADDLRACGEGRAIKSRRQTFAERTVRWVRKHRRSVLVSAVSAAAAALLVVALLFGWSRYQKNRLGPIRLKTEGQPLTAELLDGQDRLIREFTVPTREPVEVPAGEYQLRLSGKDRVSSTYQVQVPRQVRRPRQRVPGAPLGLGAGRDAVRRVFPVGRTGRRSRVDRCRRRPDQTSGRCHGPNHMVGHIQSRSPTGVFGDGRTDHAHTRLGGPGAARPGSGRRRNRRFGLGLAGYAAYRSPRADAVGHVRQNGRGTLDVHGQLPPRGGSQRRGGRNRGPLDGPAAGPRHGQRRHARSAPAVRFPGIRSSGKNRPGPIRQCRNRRRGVDLGPAALDVDRCRLRPHRTPDPAV